ncbi:MAG: hypothetical protein KKB21_00525 [Nanoarchaeota archaeon]|nr:hypothetical protein [Nanoarchaeota archaeon]
MPTYENPTYWNESGKCDYVSSEVQITLQKYNPGTVNILDRIDCPNFCRKDRSCRDSTCSSPDGLCGYLEYPFLSFGLMPKPMLANSGSSK